MQTDNEISRWEEAIISLPDEQFFNTMRLYLGEIKTPYNKQRLTQKLASFIYNEKNSNSIITLLDSFDVKILTAISIIPGATQDRFFFREFPVFRNLCRNSKSYRTPDNL